jgi:hypothetical protein
VYTWKFEPSTRIHPFPDVQISYNTDDKLYTYEYILTHGKSCQQNLVAFNLQFDGPYLRQARPSVKWSLMSHFNLPLLGWTSDGSVEKPEESGIRPGDKVEGFTLITECMPAIIPCYFSGYSATQRLPEELPRPLKNFFNELMEFPDNMVMRWTVGPSEEIASIPPERQIDELLRMTDQALSLEWIRAVRVYTEISEQLREAGDLIKIESKSVAVGKLKQLLKNLEKNRGEYIRNDVYLLYFYHIQHMERRLSG